MSPRPTLNLSAYFVVAILLVGCSKATTDENSEISSFRVSREVFLVKIMASSVRRPEIAGCQVRVVPMSSVCQRPARDALTNAERSSANQANWFVATTELLSIAATKPAPASAIHIVVKLRHSMAFAVGENVSLFVRLSKKLSRMRVLCGGLGQCQCTLWQR